MTVALEVFQILLFVLLVVMYILELNNNRHLRKINKQLLFREGVLKRKIEELKNK